MLKNKEYNKYIKFEKTIEDLFYDSASGLFEEMGATENDNYVHSNVPQFIKDGLFDLSLLDVTFFDKYSERWLNKTGGNCYSIDIDGNLENPSDLSMLSQQLLDYFYKKWDNLYYLYMLKMGKIGEEGVDFNPIENYASYEKTTYNDVTDALTKSGVEKHSQNAQVKQAPMKTVTKVTDEYGTESGGVYTNGIKDKTEYSRKYKTTDTAGDESDNPYVSTDEKGIAGMDSTGNFGSADAGDIPASGGITGYNQSEMNVHTELGEHSTQFEDVKDNGNAPYESTERTGKHSSTSEFGGDIQSGAVVQGQTQIVSELAEKDNYNKTTFEDRTDTNVKSGYFTVEKNGNIGVQTAADIMNSFLDSDYLKKTFLDYVFADVGNFISLQCY